MEHGIGFDCLNSRQMPVARQPFFDGQSFGQADLLPADQIKVTFDVMALSSPGALCRYSAGTAAEFYEQFPVDVSWRCRNLRLRRKLAQ